MCEVTARKIEEHWAREAQERTAALNSATPHARRCHFALAQQHKLRALALMCGEPVSRGEAALAQAGH